GRSNHAAAHIRGKALACPAEMHREYAGQLEFANVGWLKAGIFLTGVLTVAQFRYWGNYLPRVFPVHLRGTGESFAANVGGRMIGTSAGLLTSGLVGLMPSSVGPSLAYGAAAVAFVCY